MACRIWRGGLKDNAIPRECTADIVIEQADKELLESAVKKLDQAFKAEYSVADKDIKVELEFEDIVSKQVLSFTSLTKGYLLS